MLTNLTFDFRSCASKAKSFLGMSVQAKQSFLGMSHTHAYTHTHTHTHTNRHARKHACMQASAHAHALTHARTKSTQACAHIHTHSVRNAFPDDCCLELPCPRKYDRWVNFVLHWSTRCHPKGL